MPFTMDDFKKLDSRPNTITSQKVEEFEISLDTPPTLEELPDSNKAYSLYASILFIDIRKSTQLVEESQARSATVGWIYNCYGIWIKPNNQSFGS